MIVGAALQGSCRSADSYQAIETCTTAGVGVGVGVGAGAGAGSGIALQEECAKIACPGASASEVLVDHLMARMAP